jgi:NAD(P)-dependent dehydrogenase (short-subunit alcohol dehydrogenase family)
MSIAGKVVFITGGTSGIGAGCTRHFAEMGAKVAFASNQIEQGKTIEAELAAAGQEAVFVPVDLADEASIRQMVSTVADKYGHIDAIHCNAGVWRQGKVPDMTEDDWNFIMGINVKGTLMTLKHVIPVMEAHGKGVVVITTSVAAQIGFPEHALYCASKAALEAVIRCLANDHSGKVRAVGVSPGTIDTPMLAATCQGWDKPVAELYAEVEQKIPVRRLGQPLDIAKAVAFLMSDDASYINGTVLVLDGGTMVLPPW